MATIGLRRSTAAPSCAGARWGSRSWCRRRPTRSSRTSCATTCSWSASVSAAWRATTGRSRSTCCSTRRWCWRRPSRRTDDRSVCTNPWRISPAFSYSLVAQRPGRRELERWVFWLPSQRRVGMRLVRFKVALSLAVGFSVMAAMSGSAATGDEGSGVTRFARVDASLLESVGQRAGFVPASLSDRPVAVVLEMADAPVAVQEANASKRGQSLSPSEKKAIRDQLTAKQNQLHGQLAAAGAQVIGQMQDAYNGIHVVVPQKNIPQLASLAGVTAIHAVPSFEVDNVHGVPFIGAPEAWGTFSGPYNASTISSHSWNVGPGVAPQANLYIYRVFGCAGSSNVVDLGINAAVAAGVNVISMSLGSPLGGTDDPTSVAAQNAFNDGISVVTSAGNEGNNAYMVGSPSTSNGILSVAAMDASVPSYPGATLSLSTGASVTAIDANGAALPSGSFPVKVLRNANGSISLGCNKAEYAGTAGMVVVTVRGSCARVARAVFGDEAGDAAVVMINNSSGYPPFEGHITSNPDTGEQHDVTIPFLGVKNDATTVAALKAADGGSVTLTATAVPNTNYKVAAGFTSGGPRNPDSAPKPDVIAPGVSVASAGMGTGAQAAVISGTSMACPMTAGIAALLKQEHPAWTGVQIKAAIMNTADSSLNLGYNSRLAGAGVVQAQNAVNSTVLATTSENLDSIAFGYVAGSGDYHADKSFTLTNYGSSAATYDLSVALNANPRGAAIGVTPATVGVPAGGTATVHATLTMSAAAFAALPSDDTFVIGPGGVVTIRGDIVASRDATDSASDHQKLSVPFMFVPRGLSNVVAGATGKFNSVPNSGGAPGQDFAATLPLA